MNHFHLKANRENHFFLRQFVSFKAIFLSLLRVFPFIGTFLPLSYILILVCKFYLLHIGLRKTAMSLSCSYLIAMCPLSGSSMIYHIKIVNGNNQNLRLVCLISFFALYDQLGHILFSQSVFLTV